MATTRKRTTKKTEKPEEVVTETPVVEEKVVESEQKVVESEQKKTEKPKQAEKEPKYKPGSIVFIAKDADADLNGFKLFPQYKKYTYTVEAYEPKSDVYTLRRLNLSLKLKSDLILAPDERAHDPLNRRQF